MHKGKRVALPEKPTSNQINAAYPIIVDVTGFDPEKAKSIAAEIYSVFVLTSPPPNVSGLTIKQTRLMLLVQDFIDQHGWSPSLDEVCEMSGIKQKSLASVALNRLDRKGFIERIYGIPRSISILKRI